MTNETFDSIGDWIEEVFGENEDITTDVNAQFDRVSDEWEEFRREVARLQVERAYLSDVANEAADVVIALSGFCRRMEIDLQSEIDRKMEINRNRKWEVFSNGTGRHIKSAKNYDFTDTGF